MLLDFVTRLFYPPMGSENVALIHRHLNHNPNGLGKRQKYYHRDLYIYNTQRFRFGKSERTTSQNTGPYLKFVQKDTRS